MTTTDIICTECNTKPRLKSLDKNGGTCVGCDCEGVKHSMDMVPYEYTVHDLPEKWVVDEGSASGCQHLGPTVETFDGSTTYEECSNCGEIVAEWHHP